MNFIHLVGKSAFLANIYVSDIYLFRFVRGRRAHDADDPVQGGRPARGPHARHQRGALQVVHASGNSVLAFYFFLNFLKIGY